MNIDFDPTADPADAINGFGRIIARDWDLDDARLDVRFDELCGPVEILG